MLLGPEQVGNEGREYRVALIYFVMLTLEPNRGVSENVGVLPRPRCLLVASFYATRDRLSEHPTLPRRGEHQPPVSLWDPSYV